MKKSLPSVLALSLIISNFSPTLSVFANEWQTQVKVSEEETKENKVSEAIVRGFALNSYDNFNAYNEKY